jgi:glycosyltransferase involved in cell wall biosynthesis
MKVAVVTVQVPFVRGGAESLADALVQNLRVRGFETELIAVPFRFHPAEHVLDHMLAARLLRVPSADRVIALKFPTYSLPHDDKVLWLLHQHRQFYDLWAELIHGPGAEGVRDVVARADRRHLSEVTRRYAISEIVRDRLRSSTGLDAEVLYPPLADPDRHRAGPYGDYVLVPGRIDAIKRQWLAVEAMRHVRGRIRLVVAGEAADRREAWRLEALIARYGLADRVTLITEWVPDDHMTELVSGARAVLIPPIGEDYGLVCIEAFASSKPVITCTDSGGAALLSVDGETGAVVAATPQAVGSAIDAVADDPALAERMGHAARERLDELNLSWDHVVAELCR